MKEEKALVVERRREEPPADRDEDEETEDEEETKHEGTEDDEDEKTEDEDEEVEVEVEVRREFPSVPMRSAPRPELEHSPALEQLLRKLAAFDRLVERQDFSRASLVATDVLHVIDHFDPLVYLPSLFSRFLSGLSAHGRSIEPVMKGGPQSLSDRALERLYRTDLDAFLRSASSAEDEP